MLGNVPGVTRELLVSLLASYSQKACPSAMANVLCDALTRAADHTYPEVDAECIRNAVRILADTRDVLRAYEDDLYLGPDASKVG
jgi:hypothetical protein